VGNHEGISKINRGMIADKDEFRAVGPVYFRERSHARSVTFKTIFDKLLNSSYV
jgi:hypothetical protein